MIIKFKEKDYTLKFTFNSFRYMENFDVSELALLETRPFKMITVAEQLLFGAINNSPNEFVGTDIVSEYLEQQVEEGMIVELLEDLISLLEDSSFFKSLQKKEKKTKKK